MAMPADLVLVRHGESEGNIANRRSRKGDHSLFTEEFTRRHDSQWRLTDAGIRQARNAGAWIRQHIGGAFDRYYCSEYIRAMETAVELNLPDATWFPHFMLRERDWGELASLRDDLRREKFADALERRLRDFFYWVPPGGESMATAAMRADKILGTLDRECSGQRVIIVAHGETLWCMRILLERWTQPQFKQMHELADGPHKLLWNCSVLHYTRRDEHGALQKYLTRVRSVWPEDPVNTDTGYQQIVRKRFSNDELRELVESVPRLIS